MITIQYGVMLNAVNIGGSLHVNIMLMGGLMLFGPVASLTVELPLLGRKGNISGAWIITGCCLLAMVALPDANGLYIFQIRMAWLTQSTNKATC